MPFTLIVFAYVFTLFISLYIDIQYVLYMMIYIFGEIKKIVWLLVPPGKAKNRLIDHLITVYNG